MSNTLSMNYKNPESKHSAREFHNGKMNFFSTYVMINRRADLSRNGKAK